MFRTAVILIVITILLTPDLVTPANPVDDRPTAGAGPVECGYHVLAGNLDTGCPEPKASAYLDPSELARVESAVQLFTEQGLRLPDLTVRFHQSMEGCNGHYGLYEPETRQVQVCSAAGHIVPHELAHAWMVEHLDEATQQEFLELRGIEAWADPDDEWRSRGVEDAAILMRMVLTENGGPQNSAGWSERRDAFELLTGNAHAAINHGPIPRSDGFRAVSELPAHVASKLGDAVAESGELALDAPVSPCRVLLGETNDQLT